MTGNKPAQTTAPVPLEVTVVGFTIGEQEFLIDPVTHTFKEKDLTQIKSLLAGKHVTLLCSVGANKHCGIESVKAQIIFLNHLLEKGIIEKVDIILGDSLQRHNHRIDKLQQHAAFLAAMIQTLANQLKGRNIENFYLKKGDILNVLASLIDSVKDHSHVAIHQFINSKLKNIRSKFSEIKKFENSENDNYVLKKIFLILNHFNLHISLNALETTLKQGARLHLQLQEFLKQFDNSAFRILHWRDLFGETYSKKQQALDFEQLEFLKKSHIAELSGKDYAGLDDYEQRLLKNFDEEHFQEEQQIIEKAVIRLKEKYHFFNDTSVISEETQTERFEKLINLYKNDSGFQREINRTGEEFLDRNRQLKEKRDNIGISPEENKNSNTAYLIEEGILFGEKCVFMYPGEKTSAISCFLELFNTGPWVNLLQYEGDKPILRIHEKDSNSDDVFEDYSSASPSTSISTQPKHIASNFAKLYTAASSSSAKSSLKTANASDSSESSPTVKFEVSLSNNRSFQILAPLSQFSDTVVEIKELLHKLQHAPEPSTNDYINDARLT